MKLYVKYKYYFNFNLIISIISRQWVSFSLTTLVLLLTARWVHVFVYKSSNDSRSQ